ncbi:MAG: hypothetical protein PHU77_02935, partial [Simplicispira sp.]|nr:hypothetical protein [Simplicispira sp.]
EHADDRLWRMLPGRVYVARGYLPPGEHRIRINGSELEQSIKVDGQYALVPLRFYHRSVLHGDVATVGQLAPAAPAAPVASAAEVPTAPAAAPAKAVRARGTARPPKGSAAQATAAPAPAK